MMMEDIKELNVYDEIALSMSSLVTEKQKAYGDSFNKSQEILKVLFPDGVKVEQYSDMLTLIRIIDKLFRVSNQKEAFGESPYRDILGYALLAIERDERTQENSN